MENWEEQNYLPLENSFLSNIAFNTEFLDIAEKELHYQLSLCPIFFNAPNVNKRAEIGLHLFGDEYAPNNFLNDAANIDIHPTTYAFTAGLFHKVFTGTMNSLPRSPSSLRSDRVGSPILPEESGEDLLNMEVERQQQHQPEVINPNTTGSSRSQVSQSTPTDDKRSRRPRKTKKALDNQDTSSQSRDNEASNKPSSKNKKNKRAGTRIEKIMTGKIVVYHERVRDITVYDVPSAWELDQVLVHLKLWGHVIQLSSKKQRKYQTLRVRVELFEDTLQAFERGEWTASLGGIPVRWYPGSYTLKERKHRERFVAVLKDIPESMDTAALFQGAPHGFLQAAGIKSFKIIKTLDGSRKLLGYYETFAKMKEMLGTQQNWGSCFLTWCVHDPSIPKSNKSPKRPSGKPEGKPTKKKEKGSPASIKSSKKVKTSKVDKQYLRNLFAEFLKSV